MPKAKRYSIKEMPTCDRCTNRLALGMAIISFYTMSTNRKIKLCGTCQTEFQEGFMKVYEERLKAFSQSKEKGGE